MTLQCPRCFRFNRESMMTRTLASATLILCLAACAPQAELVKTRTDLAEVRTGARAVESRILEVQKRLDGIEKRLEALEVSVKSTTDLQKSVADANARFDQLSTDIQLVQGKLEENNFRISDLAQKLDDRTFKISELAARIDDLDAKVKARSNGAAATPQAAAGAEQKIPVKVDPSEAYRQAKNDYDKGNFDLSLAGFQNYLAVFPDASQADNAQYWIGECYYSLNDFKKSVEAFTRVVTGYPKSDKVAGARLKIGLAYLGDKNNAKAREALNKVIKEHPASKEAEIATSRLQKIGK